VTTGGFYNRNASDIWNGTELYLSEEGDESFADEVISLAYKIDLLSGDSTTFIFLVILSEG
jgi:hypothetical protein